jgi:hypothetical protein
VLPKCLLGSTSLARCVSSNNKYITMSHLCLLYACQLTVLFLKLCTECERILLALV